MAFLKRIFFWILTNVAVIALFSVISSLLGINGYIIQSGLDYGSLLFFAAFFGFAGSLVSLIISKWMAKRMFGIRVITTPGTHDEAHLVQVIQSISSQLGITMPEVGIYPSGEVNAFATGASRNNSLVAVSQGLLSRMNKDEIEGVLAHEMAHIANGDMVTMTLIQGVINTFVIFAARVVAYAIAQGRDDSMGQGAFYMISIALEIAFGFLASLVVFWFSRWREYHADAGGARFVGTQKMIAALEALKQNTGMASRQTKGFATMKFNGGFMHKLGEWMSTHPPLEKRIAALKAGATA